MRRNWLVFAVILVLSVSGMAAATRDQSPTGPLTDQDILQMVKAGFDDSTILRYIRANDVDFDLSIPAMVSLKNSGVSQSLIQAMLSIEVAKKEIGVDAALSAIAATASNSRDDVHIFALQSGKLLPMSPEIIKWRPEGGFRNTALLNSDKRVIIGAIGRPHSELVATWPPLNMVPVDMAFYILTPRNSQASDFQLLRLSEKNDRREFRTIRADRAFGWGTPQNSVPFTLENVAPRVYKLTLPNLNVGEYGLLAPTTEVKTNSAQGEIYTFRLVE
jgi:hypothetical protein